MALSTNNEIRNWVIYKITNPNGRVYVGKTYDFNQRMVGYKGRGGAVNQQPILYNSLLKYGYDNHKVEIIDTFDSDNSYANGKEIFWIRTNMSNLNKWRKMNGMNLTDGGDGCPGAKFEGRVSPMKGKKHTEEAKKRMSEINKANPPRPFLGKKHTEATKLKMSQDRAGKVSYKKGTGLIYGADRKKIHRNKPHYNRGVKYGKEHCDNLSAVFSSLFGKPIIQLSNEGKELGVFVSIRVASKELGIKRCSIKSSLNNPNTKYKDFVFKYVNP